MDLAKQPAGHPSTNDPGTAIFHTDLDPATLRAQFDQVYARLYGRTYADSPVEIVNFRVRASLPVKLLELPRLVGKPTDLRAAHKGERPAFSALARSFVPFAVYDRYQLFPGASFPGPAIIEERESTVVVDQGSTVTVDDYGFLWITLAREARS